MGDGAFTAAARAAIYEAGGGRCVGCGSAQVTAQHRQARGMGGTTRNGIGWAVNGLPLCGSGTTGCHGWAERHPILAELLGWRLPSGASYDVPWWNRQRWCRWAILDGCPSVLYVDDMELDRFKQRTAAVTALRADLIVRP